jgi:nucleotidyltransferase/DNA polymerase involved in DNA repair
MPFGLKNAGATYQWLVNKMFQAQIRRNMEVYMDDMLVKSAESVGHNHDLREAFETLKQYEMKLNPVKCAFGVSSEKFLGYMVSSRGIKANPEKIQAILEMQSPKTTKQLQQLIGRLVALNRFIS